MRLLAFDLDDTLLDTRGTLPSATTEALDALRRTGHLVAVITARWKWPDAFDARLSPRAVATSNGAVVKVAGRTISHHTLPRNVTRAILDALPADANVKAFCADHLYGDPRFDTPTHKVRPLHEAKFAPLVKLSVEHPEGKRLRAAFEDAAGVHVFGGEGKYADKVSFSSAKATKGAALRAIARELGAPLANCWAFGDSDSDLSMLRIAGVSVQVGNEACLRNLCDRAVSCAAVGLPAFLHELAAPTPRA